MLKKIAVILLALLMTVSVFGCSDKNETEKEKGEYTYSTKIGDQEFDFDFTSLAALKDSGFTDEDYQKFADEFKEYYEANSPCSTAYPDQKYGFQLDMPADGEEIAVLHTTMGDITMRFFPEAAPKAVENFKTHIQNGYYNGLTFHRVIASFMIQGGDPNGNGTGGESIWGEPFADEFDAKLFNLRGSVAMANSGVNTNGSQFFINQAGASVFPDKENFDLRLNYQDCIESYAYNINYVESFGQKIEDFGVTDLKSFIAKSRGTIAPIFSLVPDEVWELYQKTGGNINLDGAFRVTGGHTVFAQVIGGMETVDKIAAVEVDPQSNKPLEDVVITSAEITIYHE